MNKSRKNNKKFDEDGYMNKDIGDVIVNIFIHITIFIKFLIILSTLIHIIFLYIP